VYCAINVFDTNYYLMYADKVMVSIMHMAQITKDMVGPAFARVVVAPHISNFVAVGRGRHGGRNHAFRGGCGGRGPLPSKCSSCGDMDHIMLSYKTTDDAFLKLYVAKRKMFIQKHGTHA
jgi:hypothetical protein